MPQKKKVPLTLTLANTTTNYRVYKDPLDKHGAILYMPKEDAAAIDNPDDVMVVVESGGNKNLTF